MSSCVWWTASGSTYGIYRLFGGALCQLKFINDTTTVPYSCVNCEIAINRLIQYSDLPQNAQHIYTDGSFQDDWGSCAIYNETTGRRDKRLFKCVNNQMAEYKGIILALESIKDARDQSFIVFTDLQTGCFTAWASQTQLIDYAADWTLSSCYKELCTIESLIKELDPSIEVFFVHVPTRRVHGNRVADKLARQTLGLE